MPCYWLGSREGMQILQSKGAVSSTLLICPTPIPTPAPALLVARGLHGQQPPAGFGMREPTLMKELTFSSNIGQHDLDTKSKQIQQWIEKKYQVQITIKKGKNVDEPEEKTEAIFNQILQTMPGIATFSSRPQAVKGGKAWMCVLRHLSKKEEKAYKETQKTRERDILNKENGNDRVSNVPQ
ncbi:Translation initiation factor IF-3, mitochondrial [Tupaia chinensis]|uniref:Translation initiation factor IF-3, mitochondrial n=1 Tax=Tupaia chinensis TaxID=246437 RepID=L8YC18_TUPCH|nr:Translation initiation factor IF-3, mitochondrial [Tupaia chinensis]